MSRESPLQLGMQDWARGIEKVIILSFTRSPAPFRDILLNAPELVPWIDALAQKGHSVETPTGTKQDEVENMEEHKKHEVFSTGKNQDEKKAMAPPGR